MGILLLAGLGILIVFFVILHWLFIEGSIMLIKGITTLSIYVRSIRKQNRKVRGFIALPIIFIIIGTIAVAPLSVTFAGGMSAYLENETAQNNTGLHVTLKSDDETFQLEGKTYQRLDDPLESANIMFDHNIGADQAVANLIVPQSNYAALLGPYFMFLTQSYPNAYRLYRSSEVKSNSILFDDYTNSYWCEKGSLSKVLSYYGNAGNYEHYLFPEKDKEHTKEKKDEFKKISLRMNQMFQLVDELNLYSPDNLPAKAIKLRAEDAYLWNWCMRSKDGAVYGVPIRGYSMDFIIQDNTVYYVFYEDDDNLYCYPTNIKLS